MAETETIAVVNAYTGEPLGNVPVADPAEVGRTVAAAWDAFRGDKALPIDRRDWLAGAADLLADRAEDYARMIVAETGKPIRESRVEVSRAVTTLRWSAEEALRIEGVTIPCGVTPQRFDKTAHVVHKPAGVVAAITPFNFPLNIPLHKLGPAIAAGCAVVLKPSPRAPLATDRLVKLLHEAGVPEGLLQCIHGGAETVEALCRADVAVVTFTGSTAIGRKIAEWAAGKKLTMELGGNDPVVVMDDADLDAAAETILAHRFGSAGQRCTSCKRALLGESIYEPMKQRILAGVAKLVVGDPADEATDVGPLVCEEAAVDAIEKLDAAVAGGARVLAGGTRDGAIVHPTVVENAQPTDRLVHEETFAPILPLLSFATVDEMIQLVNSTPYGLQSGLFTNRMDVIQRAFDEFEVGAVVVNGGTGFRVEPLPFGGVKASGLGREGIRFAIEEFTVLRTLIL